MQMRQIHIDRIETVMVKRTSLAARRPFGMVKAAGQKTAQNRLCHSMIWTAVSVASAERLKKPTICEQKMAIKALKKNMKR